MQVSSLFSYDDFTLVFFQTVVCIPCSTILQIKLVVYKFFLLNAAVYI
jgi:hypothetical protein